MLIVELRLAPGLDKIQVDLQSQGPQGDLFVFQRTSVGTLTNSRSF